MKPRVQIKSENCDELLSGVLDCITSIDCTSSFSSHIGTDQAAQKTTVALFQHVLLDKLEKSLTDISWSQEFCPSDSARDSIDIFGQKGEIAIAIEMDKNRADQVAKKFVSRSALLKGRKLYFISLCYPGTERMNINECTKYFGYCRDLADLMNFSYAALVIKT